MLRPVDDDPDNPRWLRRPKPQPPLLKVPTHWGVRLAWIVVQGVFFCTIMWFYLFAADPPFDFHKEPQALLWLTLFAVLVVALATGIASALLRLAGRAVRYVARSRTGARIAHEPDQEPLGVGGTGRLQEGPQIVGRGGAIQQHPREVRTASVHPKPR